MAKIIYKKGLNGQNKLECIEGIEINLLNGQCALIYPKYADLPLLNGDKIDYWGTGCIKEMTALKLEDSAKVTDDLFILDSPAAKFVRQFKSDTYGPFNMPTLLAAKEIKDQMNILTNVLDILMVPIYWKVVWTCRVVSAATRTGYGVRHAKNT